MALMEEGVCKAFGVAPAVGLVTRPRAVGSLGDLSAGQTGCPIHPGSSCRRSMGRVRNKRVPSNAGGWE